jgi:hypothetical protein
MSKTQLYIGTDLLEFNAEINVKRQVNDYRDPAIGSTVKSYTLEIPLTRTNRKILGFVDDVRSRVEVTEVARLVVNGMEVIRGKFRIFSANRFSVRAIIEGSDWITDISGTSIKDLSWIAGDAHTFSSTNIVASWTASAGAFYRYPLINFAELISGDYGTGGSDVYPYEFYMMWNIEDIVTKMFLDAGYTLASGSFFAGTFGQSLYLLSRPNPAADEFITGKALHVYVDNSTDNQANQSIGAFSYGCVSLSKVMDIDAEVDDEGNDFSTVNNRYTVPEDGTYRFQAQIRVDSEINDSFANWTCYDNYLDWEIRKNGTTAIVSDSQETHSATHIFDSNPYFNLDTGYVYLEAGDYIEVYLERVQACGTNSNPVSQTATIEIMAGSTSSFLKCVWSEQNLWPGIGQTIAPEDYLPDIDGVDFLKGLKEAFNLRFFADRNNKTIYVETSDDFYGSTVVDWSDKIDYSQGIKVEVISANYRRNQLFKWNPDTGDKAYTNEVAANGVPLTKELVIDSEYVKTGNSERTNPTFSPSPLGIMAQIGHWGTGKIPRIFGSADFVSGSRAYPAARPNQWNPRLFEWKGMVALTSGNFDYYTDFEDTTATNYTTFPQAITPDMADMYNDYLLKDWNRIEKNKIVTVTLVLSPVEIMKFMTVVGTAANEGFRATYKLNVEGVDMLFICSKIITDGDRVQAEFIQKM